RLFAGAGDVRSGEICGTRPALASGRSCVLRAFGCAAIFGERGVSRAGSPVQTLRGGVFAPWWEDSFRSDASEESEAASVGGGDSSRLREADGLLRTAGRG